MKKYLSCATAAFAFAGLLFYLGFLTYIQETGHTPALNCLAAFIVVAIILVTYLIAQAIGGME